MPMCPQLNVKPPITVLKDRTNTSHHHPWERTIKSVYYNKIKCAHNSVRNPIYPKPKEKKYSDRIKFTVVGIQTCKEFIYCANLVKGMHKYRSKTFDVPEIKGVLTTEWPSAWNDLKILYGGLTYCITTPVIILQNDQFFGGDKELKEFMESKYIYRICLDYRKEAMGEFSRYVKSIGRPFAYMHISIDKNDIGTLIFMLYSDIVPTTCENFLRLCKTRRGGYSGTPVHRIVKDGWIQCGGFGLKDTNLGYQDYTVPFDRRGVLGMCNDGREVDCSTQFFVLLQPSNWMNEKYVAFGQLVDGEQTLKKIEDVPTFYEAPTSSIIIDVAGILNLDCEDITINKGTRDYINRHIEDLIETEEFFIELLLQRVWAVIEARQKESEQSKENLQLEVSEFPKSRHLFNSRMSLPSTPDKEENKENQDFDVESYTMFEPEEYEYRGLTTSVHDSLKKVTKSFYIPLTDVPYPGEVDSTFDLKKFLRGDYCLESDLEKNLHKDKDKREVLKISNLPSDIFPFDEEEYLNVSDADLDSSEEEEIRSYIKNHVDRVSFGGDVIKNIGVPHQGLAMFNIFEGQRRSTLRSLGADGVKKYMSDIPTFTDEHIRRLRRATAISRMLHSQRQSTVKDFVTPSASIELPKLIGRDSINSTPSTTSTDSTESGELPDLVDRENKKKDRPFADRRPSMFDPQKRRSTSSLQLQGIHQSQMDTIRKVSKFDEDKIIDPDKLRLPSVTESFDKKRRQTVFAKNISRIQSFQKDITSEQASSSSLTQQKTIRFVSGTEEFHKEVHRRQTGYIHKEDLEKLNIKVDDMEKTIRFPSGTEDLHKEVHRRKTGYIHQEDLETLIVEGDYIQEDEPEFFDEEQTKMDKSATDFVHDADLDNIIDVEDDKSSQLNVIEGGAIIKELKEPTSEPYKVIKDDESSKPVKLRKSTFLRTFEDPMLHAGLAPTLKSYSPMSQIIPNTKNIFFKYDSEKQSSPLLRKSRIVESDSAYLTMSGIKFKTRQSSIVQKPLTETEKTIALRALKKYSNRPLLSVEEYQRKNRERLENIKEMEAKKLGPKPRPKPVPVSRGG